VKEDLSKLYNSIDIAETLSNLTGKWIKKIKQDKEQKFYKALQDIFIGAKILDQGGFVNLMRIKANYYSKI